MAHAFLIRNYSLFRKQNLCNIHFSLFMPLNFFYKGFASSAQEQRITIRHQRKLRNMDKNNIMTPVLHFSLLYMVFRSKIRVRLRTKTRVRLRTKIRIRVRIRIKIRVRIRIRIRMTFIVKEFVWVQTLKQAA